jgi:hypothetical protein
VVGLTGDILRSEGRLRGDTPPYIGDTGFAVGILFGGDGSRCIADRGFVCGVSFEGGGGGGGDVLTTVCLFVGYCRVDFPVSPYFVATETFGARKALPMSSAAV